MFSVFLIERFNRDRTPNSAGLPVLWLDRDGFANLFDGTAFRISERIVSFWEGGDSRRRVARRLHPIRAGSAALL